MTRDQFEASLVKSPGANRCGEAVFDFHGVSNAPCVEFRCTTETTWDEVKMAMEECWQAYLEEYETEWID